MTRTARLERLHREARLLIAASWNFERTTPDWMIYRIERIERLMGRIPA